MLPTHPKIYEVLLSWLIKIRQSQYRPLISNIKNINPSSLFLFRLIFIDSAIN